MTAISPGPDTSPSTADMSAVGFNYADVPPELAAELRERADRISQNRQTAKAAIIEIGRELIAAKRGLRERGELFGSWVEAECRFTMRTAQNFMAAATVTSGKGETLSYLRPVTLYRVGAKSAAAIVPGLIERVASGEIVPDKAVIALIRQASDERKAAKRKAREQISESEETRKRRSKRLERQRLKDQADERNREDAIAAMARALISEIGCDHAQVVLDMLGGSDGYLVICALRKQIAVAQANTKISGVTKIDKQADSVGALPDIPAALDRREPNARRASC